MTGISVSAITATTAHREWASRPPDERFASVHALYEAARARRQRIDERTINTGDVRTEADDDALVLRPPAPANAVADVGAAVRDALRFPLAGEPLEALVSPGTRATILVEPPQLLRLAPTRRSRLSGISRPRIETGATT